MSKPKKPQLRKNLKTVAETIRRDLKKKSKDFALLFAYNGVGKTRLSVNFKNLGKKNDNRDTLYFNAFTEDLFVWDNDLDNDSVRFLKMNADSHFIANLEETAIDLKIFDILKRYADFSFNFDSYIDPDTNLERPRITFSRGDNNDIKISRGEQSIFIWCVFLAITELTLDGDHTYKWVKYIYIDDPISSLDDGNVITVACHLAEILKRSDNKKSIKTIISTHHGLFFSILSKELKSANEYFLSKDKELGKYHIQDINKAPFSYHIAMLNELQKAVKTGVIYNYHFNILRTILEKTTTFFGFDTINKSIKKIENLSDEDKAIFHRAVNVFSHGVHLSDGPNKMNPKDKKLFKQVFNIFVKHYKFNL